MDYIKDTKGYMHRNNINANKKLQEIINEKNLVDIWRYQNEDAKKFTWHTKNNKKMARLDYFLISENLVNYVEKTDIRAGYKSDHSFAFMKCDFS